MQVVFQDPFGSLSPRMWCSRSLPKACWCTAIGTLPSAKRR
jgi:ABC-type dipeptide/oligopeptide/nickel transport system ATPase subunit